MRLPLEELARRGHATEFRTFLPFRPGRRPDTHVLVGQRISEEGPSRTWLAAAGDLRRVYEIDDDLLAVDPSSTAVFEHYRDPARRARILENIRSADAVTVSTDYLADVVRDQYGVTAPIFALPNCIDPAVLDLPPVIQSGPMTIGWSGSGTHRGDLEHVRQPLRRFLRRHPEVRLTLMGHDYRQAVGAPDARVKGWRSIWDDAPGYMRELNWQVALAPLASTQFNRGKSAVRALEAAARGMVVIASDIEPYAGFVEHGRTGFLVRRDHQWLEFLEMLAADEGLRARMGAAARAQAAEWTVDLHGDKWEKAYVG